MKKSYKYNEFFIGLSVVTAILIVIVSILWLTRSNFLEKGLHINLVTNNAQGISSGDPVQFRGVNVGIVQSITIKPHHILMDLKFTGLSQIPVDAQYTIGDLGLLGGKAIIVSPGQAQRYLKNSDTVYTHPRPGIMDLLSSGGKMKTKLMTILSNIDSITNHKQSENISKSLIELRRSLTSLSEILQKNKDDFHKTVANLRQISDQNKKPVNKIIQNLAKRSDALAQTITHTEKLTAKLDSITAIVSKQKGSMGQLIYNPALYQNVNRTFAHLDSLIQEIRANPKGFFEVKVF